MILGGDQPWTPQVIGVSTCPQAGSMFKEGIWNAPTKTWEGSANPRTMEGDEANYTAFLLETPSLQAASCSTLSAAIWCLGRLFSLLAPLVTSWECWMVSESCTTTRG